MPSKFDFIANSSGSGTITLDVPTIEGSNSKILYLPDGSGQISRKTNTVIYTSVANSPNNFIIPIPDFAKDITVLFDNVGITVSGQRLVVELGTDSEIFTTGYEGYSILHTSTTANVATTGTIGFRVVFTENYTTQNFSGVMRISEIEQGVYMSEHMGMIAAGDYCVGGGTVILPGNVKASRLKVTTNEETLSTIYQGNVKVVFEG